MSPATMLRFKAIVTLAVAAALLATPAWFLAWFGLTLAASGQMMARLLGAVFLGIGFRLFVSSRANDISRADCLSLAVGDSLGAVVVSAAVFSGLLNSLGWLLLATYASSALGFRRSMVFASHASWQQKMVSPQVQRRFARPIP